MEIINSKYNSLPEQVEENKQNIKKLSDAIKDLYFSDIPLSKGADSVPIENIINFPISGSTITNFDAYLMDTTGQLFQIVSVADNKAYIFFRTALVGPANNLTIGSVTTGEPGTQASASITGEAPNQVLNLIIPRGDVGVVSDINYKGEWTRNDEIHPNDLVYRTIDDSNIYYIALNYIESTTTYPEDDPQNWKEFFQVQNIRKRVRHSTYIRFTYNNDIYLIYVNYNNDEDIVYSTFEQFLGGLLSAGLKQQLVGVGEFATATGKVYKEEGTISDICAVTTSTGTGIVADRLIIYYLDDTNNQYRTAQAFSSGVTDVRINDNYSYL